MGFKIVKDNGNIKVFTPYHGTFVKKIKKLGAKWSNSAWVTADSNIDYVRDIMLEVYGESDISDTQYVDVELTFTKEYDSVVREPMYLFSRVSFKGWGRDSGAQPCEGISLVAGDVNTTGSAKNWYVTLEANSKVVMRQLPKSLVESRISQYEEDGITVEIIDSSSVRRKNLEIERDKLMNRLNDINNELESL